MPLLQSVDRIIATSTHPVYVYGWKPATEHCELESLPRPIADWLEARYPKVEVGRLCYPQEQESQPPLPSSEEEKILASAFILGFNAEQADAFIADLSCSQSKLPKSPDFYLIRCAPKHLGALIQSHVFRVRQRLLGRLHNFMRATTHKPTTQSKEKQHDHTHHH